MSNPDNPHGLTFIGMDGPGVPLTQKFAKVVGYGTALYPGDPVSRVADGSVEKQTTPGTTRITGVNNNWGAASTATNQYVYVSPGALYEAQDNNDTDGIAAIDLGLNVNLENNAGSATKLTSGTELDESTAAVTATLDVHMMELLASPDNAHGSFARIIVRINTHRYATDSVGV